MVTEEERQRRIRERQGVASGLTQERLDELERQASIQQRPVTLTPTPVTRPVISSVPRRITESERKKQIQQRQETGGGIFGRPLSPGRGLLGLRKRGGPLPRATIDIPGPIPAFTVPAPFLGPAAGVGVAVGATAEGVAAAPRVAETLERIPLLNRLTSPEEARRAREILDSNLSTGEKLRRLNAQFSDRPLLQQLAVGLVTDPLFATGAAKAAARAVARPAAQTAAAPARRALARDVTRPRPVATPPARIPARPSPVPPPEPVAPGPAFPGRPGLEPQLPTGRPDLIPRPIRDVPVRPTTPAPVTPSSANVRPGFELQLRRQAPPEIIPPALAPASTGTTIQPAAADNALDWFGKLITGREQIEANALTQQWRKQALAARAEALQARAAELTQQGVPAEQAIAQARTETLSGQLPTARTSLPDIATPEIRDALFNKVYTTLADEPLEMANTATALTNALLGKPIPRAPGIRGGSAYTRLVRVFGPDVVTAVEGKPLQEVIGLGVAPRGVSQKIAFPTEPALTFKQQRLLLDPPIVPKDVPPDTRTAAAKQLDLETFKTSLADEPRGVSQKIAFPTELDRVAFEQGVMIPEHKNRLLQAAKTAGLTTLDVGNLIRAQKASFDLSWWRQQAPLIFGNLKEFMLANADSFRSIWSDDYAKQVNKAIERDPLFPMYDAIGADFLRPLEGASASAWKRAEEFMILGGERPIQRWARKLPWLRISARAHITGTNVMNWRIFKRHMGNIYKTNEKIANGEIVLRPGEKFDIQKEALEVSKMLANWSGRGPVGRLKDITPAINAGFFSFRMMSGRLFMARSLFSSSRYVQKEAWKNLVSFVGGMSGLIVAGRELGLWEVETNPLKWNNADFMKPVTGRTRHDPWGGTQQYTVLMARLITGTGISSQTLEKFAARDRLETITSFIENKKHPFIGIVLETLEGRDFRGRKIDNSSWETWVNRSAAISMQDMWEAFEAEGFGPDGLSGGLGIFGDGVLSYEIPTWPEVTPYYALTEAKDRTRFRKRNPELDAKLFILGRFTTVQTIAAKFRVLELMRENRIKPKHVRGFEKLFKRTTLDVPRAVPAPVP